MEPKQSRAPKLFYVTTQSSTTTLTTDTNCFVSLAAITAACGRKKRMIHSFGITGEEINPSKLVKSLKISLIVNLFLFTRFPQSDPSVDELAEEETDVEGSKNRVDSSREGKFLVYWMTTTSISTITSYSSTRTIASLACTPSNYGVSVCG